MLYKQDTDSSNYEVYRTGLLSGVDGGLLIEDLEPGNYKLVETVSPTGYRLPDDPETYFTITL